MSSLTTADMTLTIGRTFRAPVASLAAASRLFQQVRDDFEGVHGPSAELPAARVVCGEKAYRVSYNGNIYDGDEIAQKAV